MGTRSKPRVEVRRSEKRRRTVSAYREGDRIVVLVPSELSAEEEREWVERMVARVERKERKAAAPCSRGVRNPCIVRRCVGPGATARSTPLRIAHSTKTRCT